jgi:hypothetical protein
MAMYSHSPQNHLDPIALTTAIEQTALRDFSLALSLLFSLSCDAMLGLFWHGQRRPCRLKD